MKIKVTQEHINNGEPRITGKCPIALALIEKFGDTEVSVGVGIFSVGRRFWWTPAKAVQFIKDFDENRPVVPFEFEISEAR